VSAVFHTGARETREEVLKAKGVSAMSDLLRPWTRKKLTTGVSDEVWGLEFGVQ